MSDSDQKGMNNKDENTKGKQPSELVIGTITFIVFLVFMTGWMYFGVVD